MIEFLWPLAALILPATAIGLLAGPKGQPTGTCAAGPVFLGRRHPIARAPAMGSGVHFCAAC